MSDNMYIGIGEGADDYVTVDTLIRTLEQARDAGQIRGDDRIYVDGGMASGYLTRPWGKEDVVDIA